MACPAPTSSAIITLPPEPVATMPGEPPRGKLERVSWVALPNWGQDDAAAALLAFRRGCPMLRDKPEWLPVCDRAMQLPPGAGNETIKQFFQDHFQPFHVVNADQTDSGTITGYYEPLLRGSRVRTSQYAYPLYGPPQDLISVDLGEIYPDLKNRRLRGRVVGNKLVPYYERGNINTRDEPLKGLEIVWVDDPVEAFFLEIQGSGQIQLPDGSRIRLGYADQNGHPFRSLAGQLIRRGEIKAERASMQGIKEWAKRNPGKLRHYLNTNPSYVFFKELPNDLSGPIGTLGVPLTAERSIAVDQSVIPLGVPVYLATTFPGTPQPLNRLMVAQDTGGAIGGAVRADFFWGFGDAAGAQAGRMKQAGRMWVLLPRGYDPNATAAETIASPPEIRK
jgi:membrane-bound lytic murein transglycosylase A